MKHYKKTPIYLVLNIHIAQQDLRDYIHTNSAMKSTLHPVGNMNVCTKFHGNPFSNC